MSLGKQSKVAKAIVENIQGVLDKHQGSWDNSFFFRATQRKLIGIINQLEPFCAAEHHEDGTQRSDQGEIVLLPGEIMVYIHVYHAQGGRLNNWLSLVRLVGTACASRPIYKDEEAVKAILDRRGMPETEGYLAVKVQAGNVLEVPDDRRMVDGLGQPLLALKSGALKPSCICYFVHGHYGTYRYVKDDFVAMK